MLQTPHVVIGCAIAINVGNPYLAIPLSLASHFVLDRVPHWNPHTYTEAVKYGIPKRKTLAVTAVDIGVAFSWVFGSPVSFFPTTDAFLSFFFRLWPRFSPTLPNILFSSLKRQEKEYTKSTWNGNAHSKLMFLFTRGY